MRAGGAMPSATAPSPCARYARRAGRRRRCVRWRGSRSGGVILRLAPAARLRMTVVPQPAPLILSRAKRESKDRAGSIQRPAQPSDDVEIVRLVGRDQSVAQGEIDDHEIDVELEVVAAAHAGDDLC